MNKAFVREPEPVEPRCPAQDGCGSLGTPVTRRTLESQLVAEEAAKFSESAFYCANPHCEVAYFDAWGTSAPRSALRTAAYPKCVSAPLCSCLGISSDEIRREAEAGRKERVREILASAERQGSRCETEAPSGASCIAEIRQLFLKYFAG